MANTTRVPFYPSTESQRHLLSVEPGVVVEEALSSIYCLLDMAQTLTLQLNDRQALGYEQIGNTCHLLICTAKATVEACMEGESEAKTL